MYKTVLSLSLFNILLSAGVVVPDEYLISDNEKLSYIYSDEYSGLMPDMKNYQEEILKGYEKEYGFKLDDKLYVGLASRNNQIANGFSTNFLLTHSFFMEQGQEWWITFVQLLG